MMLSIASVPAITEPSAKTLKIPEPTEDHSAIMIRNSRERYATVRHVVEEKIAKWAEEISKEGEVVESATPINSEHPFDREKGQQKEDNDSHDSYGEYSKYLENIKVQLGGSMDEMKQTENQNQDKQDKRQDEQKDERNATESSSANKALKIKELTSKIIQHSDSDNSKSNDSSDKEDARQTKGLSRGDKREIKHGEVIKFN